MRPVIVSMRPVTVSMRPLNYILITSGEEITWKVDLIKLVCVSMRPVIVSMRPVIVYIKALSGLKQEVNEY